MKIKLMCYATMVTLVSYMFNLPFAHQLTTNYQENIELPLKTIELKTAPMYFPTQDKYPTTYVQKSDGRLLTTFERDLSNWDIEEVKSVGFYKDFFGKMQVVKMPRTIKKVPLQISSKITSLEYMFQNCDQFNQDISLWDTSNIKSMKSMFGGAKSFNKNLSQWNTSNVTNMSFMFFDAKSFNNNNAPLKFNTSNVKDMSGMFKKATSFNQDVSIFNVSNVIHLDSMFNGATSFQNNGKPLNWNNQLQKVETIGSMFLDAIAFNQDLSQWNVSNVRIMSAMFSGAKTFNNGGKPLNWGNKLYNVTHTNGMFSHATSFNQDISAWNMSNVINSSYMFFKATSFNQNISAWNMSSVTNMNYMFNGAVSFNQDLSRWNVSKVFSHTSFANQCPINETTKMPKFRGR